MKINRNLLHYSSLILKVGLAIMVLLFFPFNSANAGGVKGVEPQVFDANGKVVGPIVGFHGTEGQGAGPLVALEVNGIIVPVVVEPSELPSGLGGKFPSRSGRSVLFESADCSTQAFILDPSATDVLLPFTWVVGLNDTLYYLNGNPAVQVVDIEGILLPGAACLSQSQGSNAVRSVTKLTDLGLFFQAPFSAGVKKMKN